jgi:all-trans-retinol 13,14-reductase
MNRKGFDVVIIGSGLGGLLCGAILSKYGHHVCLLERHHKIGGNLQTFERKGVAFNSAMHYVGGLDRGQILHKVFSHLGIIDGTGTERLDSTSYEVAYIGDHVYSHANGIEAYRDRMLTYFPSEERAIVTYLKKIKEVWDSTHVLNLKDFRNLYDVETQYTRQNAFQFIEGLTANADLKALWGVNSALYAGVPEISPLITHAIINYHYIQSAYKFSYGSDKMAAALKEVILAHGGEVQTNAEVDRLLFEGNSACAAELKDGSVIHGKSFISNIHPSSTIELVEPGRFRKAYIRRVRGLENTIGAFCTYIKFKKRKFRDINSNVFISAGREVWYAGCYDRLEWPSACMLYTMPDQANPGYAESMVVSTFMKYGELKQWENTTVEKRGEDYRAFKDRKARALISLVETKIPGILDTMDEYYTASPLTFRDYTGIPEGSSYGILKDCHNPRNSYISPNTRVPNLYLTGQNSGVGLHGVLGVTVSALFTSANFIDIGVLLKKIRNE